MLTWRVFAEPVTIDDLQYPDGSIAHTGRDKAETLNRYFTSVFTRNLSQIPFFTLDRSSVLSLHTVTTYVYHLM